MKRNHILISILILILITVVIYWRFALDTTHTTLGESTPDNLHDRLLIPLYSNNPDTAWLLTMDTDERETEHIELQTTGLLDITIDDEGNHAWLATYGVEFGKENSYVMAVSIDDGTIHKVDIDGKGPQTIKTKEGYIYTITHDNGFQGHVIKIDPRKQEMVASQKVDGFLDAFAFDDDGYIYVSSFYIDDNDSTDKTILTQIDADSLTIDKQVKYKTLLNSRALLEKNGSLYSTDGSNQDATREGKTITKINTDTLDITERIDVEPGMNNLIPIPASNHILILKNNEGVPNDSITSPYAFLLDTESDSIKPMDNIPFLAGAQFHNSENDTLWGVTYQGDIIKYQIGNDTPEWRHDLNIKEYEDNERDNIKVFNFIISD